MTRIRWPCAAPGPALWTPERADALEDRFAELARRAALALASPAPDDTAPDDTAPDDTAPASDVRGYTFGTFRLIPGPDRHQEAVRKAVEYIHQGDIFQANI